MDLLDAFCTDYSSYNTAFQQRFFAHIKNRERVTADKAVILTKFPKFLEDMQVKIDWFSRLLLTKCQALVPR